MLLNYYYLNMKNNFTQCNFFDCKKLLDNLCISPLFLYYFYNVRLRKLKKKKF